MSPRSALVTAGKYTSERMVWRKTHGRTVPESAGGHRGRGGSTRRHRRQGWLALLPRLRLLSRLRHWSGFRHRPDGWRPHDGAADAMTHAAPASSWVLGGRRRTGRRRSRAGLAGAQSPALGQPPSQAQLPSQAQPPSEGQPLAWGQAQPQAEDPAQVSGSVQNPAPASFRAPASQGTAAGSARPAEPEGPAVDETQASAGSVPGSSAKPDSLSVPQAQPRRVRLAQMPYLIVLGGAALALETIRQGGRQVQDGTLVLAGVLLTAALARLVLPDHRAGMLSSRGRPWDVTVFVVLGIGLLVAGLVLPVPS